MEGVGKECAEGGGRIRLISGQYGYVDGWMDCWIRCGCFPFRQGQ